MIQQLIDLIQENLGIPRYYLDVNYRDTGYLWDLTRTITLKTRGRDQVVSLSIKIVTREKFNFKKTDWKILYDGKTFSGETQEDLKICIEQINLKMQM